MIRDDLIKENSMREAFAGAFLSIDKRSGITFVKAPGRQKSSVAFSDGREQWDQSKRTRKDEAVTIQLNFIL